MKKSQELTLRSSEIRARLNQIAALEGDALTAEIRTESDTLTGEYGDVETRRRAAIIGEDAEIATATAAAPDAETRERLELRGRATLGGYLLAALRGRDVDGAEAEHRAACHVDHGIPLDLFAGPVETRGDAVSESPGTVGVNMGAVQQMLFAPSVAPLLGVAMPTQSTGTFATSTITTALTAATKAKGAAAESTAAALTVQTSTVKRISGRLTVREEDLATVGVSNFESALRQNLSLIMSDAFDAQALTGDGQGTNLTGFFKRLTDAADPTVVADWDAFNAAYADAIDGLWASTVRQVRMLAGVATYRRSVKTFRDIAAADLGDTSAASYLAAHTGGWATNKRMPAAKSNIQAAIAYRLGRSGIETAVLPLWNRISIDDPYTSSASAERHLTLHILCGDVLLTQPGAYAEVRYKLA